GDDYLELVNDSAIALHNITVNAWINGSSFGNGGASGNEIINFDNIATTSSLDAYSPDENSLSAELRWEWPSGITPSGYTINANNWYLVTAVYNTTTGVNTVYVNGEKVKEETETS